MSDLKEMIRQANETAVNKTEKRPALLGGYQTCP